MYSIIMIRISYFYVEQKFPINKIKIDYFLNGYFDIIVVVHKIM